jgi:hypothetical protein
MTNPGFLFRFKVHLYLSRPPYILPKATCQQVVYTMPHSASDKQFHH